LRRHTKLWILVSVLLSNSGALVAGVCEAPVGEEVMRSFDHLYFGYFPDPSWGVRMDLPANPLVNREESPRPDVFGSGDAEPAGPTVAEASGVEQQRRQIIEDLRTRHGDLDFDRFFEWLGRHGSEDLTSTLNSYAIPDVRDRLEDVAELYASASENAATCLEQWLETTIAQAATTDEADREAAAIGLVTEFVDVPGTAGSLLPFRGPAGTIAKTALKKAWSALLEQMPSGGRARAEGRAGAIGMLYEHSAQHYREFFTEEFSECSQQERQATAAYCRLRDRSLLALEQVAFTHLIETPPFDAATTRRGADRIGSATEIDLFVMLGVPVRHEFVKYQTQYVLTVNAIEATMLASQADFPEGDYNKRKIAHLSAACLMFPRWQMLGFQVDRYFRDHMTPLYRQSYSWTGQSCEEWLSEPVLPVG
jgi:hypothetical protein